MYASPLTTQYTRFALLVLLPLIMFGSGCGDSGNINPNALDTGVVGPTGDTGATGNPSTVVINEIFPEASQIELHNPGTELADISGFWLCHSTPALIYTRLSDNTIIQPGGI